MANEEIWVDLEGIRERVGLTETSVAGVEPETLTPEEYSKVLQIENLLALHERLNNITETLKCVIQYDLERILGIATARETQDGELAAIFGE